MFFDVWKAEENERWKHLNEDQSDQERKWRGVFK
jgi:hypothetical protein